MKTSKLITTMCLVILMMSIGCSDEFTTREPQAQISEPDLATLEGVEGILLGSYNMLAGHGLQGQTWRNEIQNWVFNLPSDDALKGTDAGDQPEQSFIEQYDFQSFNLHIRDKWRGLYLGVATANDAINTLAKIEEGGVSDERRQQIIAEARFLRGIFHFEARKMWRRPVYIDENIFSLNDLSSTSIPNDQEIWPFIEADFEAAAAVLPATQADIGRPTSWAAKAFLAKAKVYQGFGEDGTANTTKLQEAKPILEDILNNGPFTLVANFQDNFLVNRNNNEESIFEVQYAISQANADVSNRGVGLAHPYTAPWGCCGFYQASQNLVNAFKTEGGLPMLDTFNDENVPSETDGDLGPPLYQGTLDPRLDHTLGRPGVLYKGFKVHRPDFIRDINYAGPYSPMKHVAEPERFGEGGWQVLSANNYRLMRLGMVILWLAEVEVELGNLERARELVNLIRERASNPDGFVPLAQEGETRNDFEIVEGETAANYEISQYNEPWTDQDTARKAVRFETRLEFAMEGHRFFDLQRWGIAAETLSAYIQSESQLRAYLAGKTFVEGRHEYYPIPLEAIDRSQVDGVPVLVQDPAY